MTVKIAAVEPKEKGADRSCLPLLRGGAEFVRWDDTLSSAEGSDLI